MKLDRVQGREYIFTGMSLHPLKMLSQGFRLPLHCSAYRIRTHDIARSHSRPLFPGHSVRKLFPMDRVKGSVIGASPVRQFVSQHNFPRTLKIDNDLEPHEFKEMVMS